MYNADIHSTWSARDIPSGDIILKDLIGYPLWVNEYTKADEIPTNCRIDDYTAAKLIDEGKSATFYHSRWPVEFDVKKMVKAVRMPLGFAAKMWVNPGDKDRHGEAAPECGWYYKWYRGLHLLCGEEGIHQYKHRPSHEDALKDIWYFDLGHKCIIYQENERGDEETRQVTGVIGSQAVAAIVPIDSVASGTPATATSSRKGKRKEDSRQGKGHQDSGKPKGEKRVKPEKVESETPRKGQRLLLGPTKPDYKPMKSKAIVDTDDERDTDDEEEGKGGDMEDEEKEKNVPKDRATDNTDDGKSKSSTFTIVKRDPKSTQ